MEYLLSPNNIDRRVFVKGIGLISIGLLLSTLGGCEGLAEAIRNRPVRRRLRTGSAEVDADIATYRQAVTLMKALGAGDPRKWTTIAAVHGSVAGGFNLCQHGTDHFFSWHRAYLFYFEKICQKLTGNPHFGLPYWNWNQNPDINPAFLDVSSPLYLGRTRTTMSGDSAVSAMELDPIFGDTNFFSFGSQIEGTPHNETHSHIGATMVTGGSALDPLFWTHHCMIDYCWAKWNIELGNDNTNDAGWNGTAWDYFVDGDGNPAHMTAGLTTIMPLLSYQYESSAIGSFPAAATAIKTKAEFSKVEKRIKEGANIKFEIKQRIPIQERTEISIARPFSKETKVAPADFERILNNDAAKEKIFASIQYAELPAESDFYVRVFINLPNADAQTPTTDAHYAGSYAFFGTAMKEQPMEMHEGGHKHIPKFLVNLTPALQRLRKNQELKDNAISVQLVAVPYEGKFENPETKITLTAIEFIVTPVIINSKQ